MDKKHYRASVVLGRHRLNKLIAERNKLNEEIERVSDYIRANANFLPDAERGTELQKLEQALAGPPGFTDAIRGVMKANFAYFNTAMGVRDLLVKSKFDLSGYTNPLASVHTILKRLVERGEVETEMNNGENYYRWKRDVPRRRAAIYG